MRTEPREAADPNLLKTILAEHLDTTVENIKDFKIVRRSIDARQKNLKLNLKVKVATGHSNSVIEHPNEIEFPYLDKNSPAVIIVGAGPAGLFAALRALELGIRPIILERGKDVDRRRMDIVALNREKVVNPNSNFCFGEGGAGTFSDGKLFTRSKKRGNVDSVLQLLCQHGASEDILIDTHAHIGSDKLPHIIKAIRNTIISHGGEVHFDTKVTDIIIEDDRAIGVKCENNDVFNGPVLLATGHSARDIYRLLDNKQIALQPKGFAVGVRLEHPQLLIDRIQYHSKEGRGKFLPPAEYNFVTQADGRGVYSFCMCPGGVIVPAESGPNQLVVNGMSASARAGRWANSGMVVEIRPEDFSEYAEYGNLRLLKLQEDLEEKFYKASGPSLNAPAQRMKDFVEGKDSDSLPSTSYVPGIHPERFDKLLPKFISDRLKSGFKDFGRRSKGFLTNEATMIGLESRTSSPVRIPRDKDSLEHIEIHQLYPAGEGAGYAGGIVSAAIDGRRCVDAYYQTYIQNNQVEPFH